MIPKIRYFRGGRINQILLYYGLFLKNNKNILISFVDDYHKFGFTKRFIYSNL
jgi:hypothetical protein